MSSTALTAWRDRLAHDSVKNTLRRGLGNMRNDWQEHRPYQFLLGDSFSSFWDHARDLPAAIRALASQIESAYSPASMIPPPAGDPSDKPNLAALVHDLYLRKGPAKRYEDELKEAASTLEKESIALRFAIASSQPLETAFDEFEKAIDLVDKALHNIPEGILLP